METQETQFLNPENIIKQIDLAPGAQIGDLGCGTGYMSFAASHIIGEKGKIYAVDVQQSVLEQVKKQAQMENLANIETIWSDLEALGATDIAEHSLDMVFLVNVLFLINDKASVVKEAKRLLKETGKILIVEWKKGDMHMGPPTDKRLDLANIRQITQEQGLKEEKEINAGKYHFGVIFKV